ncbi:MAG: ATP synthase F1 subunit epsilon [Alphaproteobacteria bacterium]|nr:ATP synthase F1 subunit epsilon [Alphaproteobacteria bacterium]
MTAQIKLELVSPDKLFLSRDVTLVTMPGDIGYFGVLAGHAPVIASLSSGVVEINDNNVSEVSERIFIEGGFARITNEKCILLAEGPVPVKDIDRTEVEKEINALIEDIANLSEKEEGKRSGMETRLAIVKAKLEAAIHRA